MISESMDLMNRIPGAFFVFDRKTYKFVFVSDGLLNLFGLSEKAFLERYFNSFEMFIYKEDRKYVKELIEGQFGFDDFCDANFRVKSIMEESERFMAFQGRLVVENDGSENVYGVLFDMTEMVVSQQEINRMNQELYNKTIEIKAKPADTSKALARDAVSGLLTKDAVTETITDFMSGCAENELHAFVMIDCDDFTKFSLDHGDAVDDFIKYFGSVLKRAYRDSDIKGRIGGDEFIVLMKNTTKDATEMRSMQLNETVRKPYIKGGEEIKISCSIGVSYYPEDGKDFETLYRKAEEALEKAKSLGKDRFVEYGN
ncbi:MAG: sensor domain-containing diguanylate cyclase [Lachnospiraceae bacterium]|nr:sensor domain-containing diguanylate cyclase [Lachnospiraceae bacterium]